jgi:hypothetical protein
LVDGRTANALYGVDIKSGGPCPGCGGPAEQILQFNPRDSYYYFTCPLCNRAYRYLNPDGSLSDLKQVKSKKTTPLDEDVDFPENWV